jgi:hypothetical protein
MIRPRACAAWSRGMEEMSTEAAPEVGMAQLQLDIELAVLRALPGVTAVADFPAGGVATVKQNDPNKNGVRLKLHGRLVKQTFNANISDKAQAARVLKGRMNNEAFVGEAAVLAAEEQVRLGAQPSPQTTASAELTEAELHWLSNWYDEQAEPDLITLEQANAAIARHRASSGGASMQRGMHHFMRRNACIPSYSWRGLQE